MTTRQQILRSSTARQVPAAGTRQPGELWTNFSDLQLGVIDASRNAQNLLAVRFFSTQTNYITGECIKHNGQLWLANQAVPAGAFSVSQWTQIASMADVGAISPMGDNRVLNGDMRIDQRNNGANGTTTGYTVDRWFCGQTVPGKIQWAGRPSGPVLLALGFPYFLTLQTVSAYTAAATETYNIQQRFEADMIGDFAWGTPGAQPVTLSFWANSTIAGTHSGAIRNDTNTRSYPFTFSLPAASTWTKIVITIPGDTGTPWVMSGNAQSAQLVFDLGSGSNLRAPAAGVWSSNIYTGVTGAVSILTTANATFNITGVKLEIGNVATPFNRYSLAKSLADCQRYYVQPGIALGLDGYATGAGVNTFIQWSAPVTMRAAPTIIVTAWGAGLNVTGGPVSVQPDNRTIQSYITALAVGAVGATLNITSLSAEL